MVVGPAFSHLSRPRIIAICAHSIGTPDPATPTIYDRIVRVALVHVVALEDLPVASPASTNGPPA